MSIGSQGKDERDSVDSPKIESGNLTGEIRSSWPRLSRLGAGAEVGMRGFGVGTGVDVGLGVDVGGTGVEVGSGLEVGGMGVDVGGGPVTLIGLFSDQSAELPSADVYLPTLKK